MKKIMFNDEYGLTEAVLQGRKTMTRRTVRGEYLCIYEDMSLLGQPRYPLEEWLIHRAADYKVGDVVAVAQSYKSIFEESLNYALPRYHWLDDHIDEKGFKNKMFVKASEMPHQIQITNIKVERLQDISDEDILREGITKSFYMEPEDVQYYYEKVGQFKDGTEKIESICFLTARDAFADLIDKVSGKGTWELNPYVFAYTFELIK